MQTKTMSFAAVVGGTFFFIAQSHATTQRIEPDNYAEGAVLNDIHPLVELRIYNGFIQPNFPAEFGVFPDPEVIPVTSNENEDILGGYFTSTGTKSFGHANITFFPESAQLAMRFLVPTSQVSIDFIGTNSLSDAVGVLEVFNSQGTLLDSFTSAPVTAHEVVTLSVSRPLGDIGYARAFSSPEEDPFGALDNLQFVTSSPSLPGDYNGDGSVDAADYVVWRNGLGTNYSSSHYNVWRENFGKTAANGGAIPAHGLSAVPEPASTLLLSLSSMLLFLRRPPTEMAV